MDLLASGWKQGSVLPRQLGRDLARLAPRPLELGEQDLGIVISHDCDVAQAVLEKEPWVDLIVARGLDRLPSEELTYGKHPRLLEVEAVVSEQRFAYRLSSAEHWRAPRERLVGSEPSGYFATVPLLLVPAWISGQFIRAAFPDEFNRRWRSASRDLRQLLAGGAGDINSIYIYIDDIELAEGQDYRIILRGVMPVRDYDVETRRTRAHVTLGRIAGALSACEGIHVVDEELLSERDVSLDDIRVMKRWSPFDTLSLTEDDN